MIRICDIIISLAAMVILSPLFLIVMIILRFTGEGYVFYKQLRVGKNGKLFGLYKFATMLKDSPNIGPGLLTLKNDPRVFPFGGFLRKTKINELPQLINVLIGDMSIVGRRPQVEKHFNFYPNHIKERIVKMKPGLTGIGSIVFRDEEKIISNSLLDHEKIYANLIAPYKGALELWFLERRSILKYFILIYLTAWVIINPNSKVYNKLFKDLPVPPPELVL